MNLEELDNFLINEDIWWQWKNNDTLIIHSPKWDTTISLDIKKISDITSEQIKTCLCGGKDIQQMTRVTGYFSIIANWNNGKRGELVDRHKIKEDDLLVC